MNTPSPATARDNDPTDERDDLLSELIQRPRRREVWVGAFVLIGLASTLIALFALTDAAFFRGRYIVTTVVDDAGGIRKGDPVQMRGVNIGRVQRFEIGPDGVAIRLEVEGEYDIPTDSHVVLRSSGILGGVVADVVPGRATAMLDDGDIISGRRVSGLMDTAEDVSNRADIVLERAQALLSPATIDAVGTSAQELQRLLAELNRLALEQRRELAAAARGLRGAAESVQSATAGVELRASVERLDSALARIDLAAASLERSGASLHVVLGRLERGEGTLGRLSVDPALYESLQDASRNIAALAADIRANPRKYVNLEIF